MSIASPKALAAGTLLAGRYKIQKLLVERAGGARYVVRDTKVTDRLWLAEEFFPDSNDFEKLKTEIETAKEIRHPNIVQTFDSFIDGNRFYAISEYIEGFSVFQLLELTAERLTETQVLEWGLQISDALLALKEKPIKLNPKSLILDRDNRIRLIPYSFADTLPGFESEKPATDLYRLSEMLYFFFKREMPEFPLPPLPGVSEPTRALLSKALHPDAAKRFPDLEKFQSKLDAQLHPPVEIAAQPPRVDKLKTALYSFYEPITKGTLFLRERPYILILFIAFFAALFFHRQGTIQLQAYHKNSPILFLTTPRGLLAIDGSDGKRLHRFSSLKADRGIFISKNGGELWAVSKNGTIAGIDPSNGISLHQFNVHQVIGGSAMTKAGFLYLALQGQNMIATLAGANGKIIAFYPVEKESRKIAYSGLSQELYVSFESKPYFTVLNLSNGSLKNQWNLPGVPSDFLVSPDGTLIAIVFNDLNLLKVFDCSTKNEVYSILLNAKGPYHLFESELSFGVTAYDGNQIFLFDQKNGAQKGAIGVEKPLDAVFTNGEREIAAATQKGIERIDVDRGRVVSEWKTGMGSSLVYIP